MKLIILLSLITTFGLSQTQKETCIKDLKSLHQLNMKLQEDVHQYEQSSYEHNIYGAELHLIFTKKNKEKIKNIVKKVIAECESIISKNELLVLEKNHFYIGDLLQ